MNEIQKGCFFIFCFLFYTFPNWNPWSSLQALEIKLKNLAKFEESRLNQITGFGLVIGLSNTGDTRSPFTEQALSNYLNSLGIDSKLKPKDTRNTASVIITGFVPTWAKPGDKIDVYVSSIGDARSLDGGFLIQSPLKAANGETIAVASGILQSSTNQPQTGRRYTKKSEPNNTAIVLNGGIIEKGFRLTSPTKKDQEEEESYRIKIILNEPSIPILSSIQEKIQETYSDQNIASNILNTRELELRIPSSKDPYQMIRELEELEVETTPPAKVVINQKTGLIVMGGNLVMEDVAISKAGMKYKIESKGKSRYFWSDIEDKQESVFHIQKVNNLKKLVEELNRIGASTEDIIAIIQGLKKAGILHGEVIIE